MLLKITEKCRMNCAHCMIDASEEKEHMSMDTFYKVIPFLKKVNPFILLITGGEPTEHPNFIEIVRTIIKELKLEGPNLKRITITSNGMFSENEKLTKELIDLDVLVQIVNDKRYYTQKIKKEIKHDNFMYCYDLPSKIFPGGRALKNNLRAERETPFCFNIRQIFKKKTRNLKDAVKVLEMFGKFCTPSINIDRSISIGESNTCQRIGHIWDSEETINNNLLNLSMCDKCGLFTENHRKILEMDFL